MLHALQVIGGCLNTYKHSAKAYRMAFVNPAVDAAIAADEWWKGVGVPEEPVHVNSDAGSVAQAMRDKNAR